MWLLIFLCLFSSSILYFYVVLCGRRKGGNGVRTLIVIGSGGHTAEMLSLVKNLTSHYHPRTYVMAANDVTSESKIIKTETELNRSSKYCVVKIPRSRNVHQSYITSVVTTFYSVVMSVFPILTISPDLILCNGPGTCIPICIIAYVFKKVAFWDTKIIFVESICRVKTLSLSGKILMYIVDHVLVQWPELVERYPKTKFLGRLI